MNSMPPVRTRWWRIWEWSIRLGDDVLEAEMPVDSRTHQPFGLLHGGASAALAETLGSMAGYLMTRDGQCGGDGTKRHASSGGIAGESTRRLSAVASWASKSKLGNRHL
jgi:hypothetical protein